MIENWNYISDEELERLINQVEQEELVAAPPDLLESILNAEREISHLTYCEAACVSAEAAKRIPKVGLTTEEFAKDREISPTERLAEADTAVEMATKVIKANVASARKKEFHAYCFRVITSVAAAVALVFLLPELTNRMNLNEISISGHYDKSTKVQNSPSCNEVVMPLSSKAEIAEGNTAPSKAEVAEGSTTPSKAEIMAVELIPSKAEVVKAKAVPSKEEVLQDTGFIGKIIGSGWFNKESDTQY